SCGGCSSSCACYLSRSSAGSRHGALNSRPGAGRLDRGVDGELDASELLLAPLLVDGLVALLELGEELATERVDRLHDVLVLPVAGLRHEDHDVQVLVLVPLERLAQALHAADSVAGARRPIERTLH